MLKRMLLPNNMAVRHLSQEAGIFEATLHKWRVEARGKGQPLPDAEAEERLRSWAGHVEKCGDGSQLSNVRFLRTAAGRGQYGDRRLLPYSAYVMPQGHRRLPARHVGLAPDFCTRPTAY